MATCGLTVAAVAVPVGLLGWAVIRRTGVPVLPRPRPWRVPWTGFEVLVGFFVLNLVIPPVVFVGLEKVGFFQQVYGRDFPRADDAPPAAEPEASAAAGVPAVVAAKEQRADLATVRNLWAGVLALPVQLGFLLLARVTLYPGWRSPTEQRTIPARVALGVAGWAVLTP